MMEELAEWFALTEGPYQYDTLGRISCTLLHPRLGPIPYTADPNDPEPSGVAIFNAIVAWAANILPAN